MIVDAARKELAHRADATNAHRLVMERRYIALLGRDGDRADVTDLLTLMDELGLSIDDVQTDADALQQIRALEAGISEAKRLKRIVDEKVALGRFADSLPEYHEWRTVLGSISPGGGLSLKGAENLVSALKTKHPRISH